LAQVKMSWGYDSSGFIVTADKDPEFGGQGPWAGPLDSNPTGSVS